MSTQSRERSRSEKAAAVQKENARRERNRKVGVAGAIIVVIAVIAAGVLWATRGTTTPEAAGPSNVKAVVANNSLVVGDNADAKTKVVVYEDFLCPYCKQFESQSRDFLRTDAAQGKVLVTYRPFHLLQDDYSTLALNAWSQVLDQGTPAQALSFHDALYDNQPYEQDANKPGVSDLEKLAEKSGVPSSVTSSFGTENKSFLEAVQTTAQQNKIQSTPTIMVNGKPLEGASIDELVSNLEKQIASAG